MAFLQCMHVPKITVKLGNTRVLHAYLHGFTVCDEVVSANLNYLGFKPNGACLRKEVINEVPENVNRFSVVFTSRAAARSYAALDYSCCSCSCCSRSDFCFFQHWNIFYWYFVIWMVIIFQFFWKLQIFKKIQTLKKFQFSKNSNWKKFKLKKKIEKLALRGCRC